MNKVNSPTVSAAWSTPVWRSITMQRCAAYKLANGKTVAVKRTAPWTWLAHEAFQINPQGKISQVEAVLLSVPYGMRPGRSTGVRMPSPQAVRDRFTE